MASTFMEVCREVVTWVRTPSQSASTHAAGVRHAVNIHPRPIVIGGPARTPGRLHHISNRLRDAGWKKIVTWSCVVTGGATGTAFAVDKAVVYVSNVRHGGSSTTSVPEPSSLYLFAFGLAAMWLTLHWMHRKLHPAAAKTDTGQR